MPENKLPICEKCTGVMKLMDDFKKLYECTGFSEKEKT